MKSSTIFTGGLMFATAVITWIAAAMFYGKPSADFVSRKLEHSRRTSQPSGFSNEGIGHQAVPNANEQDGIHPSTRRNMPREPLDARDTNLDKFNRASAVAASSGDFTALSRFFDSLSQDERYFFYDRVAAIFSKMGPRHDINEKMALLDKVNTYSTSLECKRLAVLEREAVERYDEMKREGVLETLTENEFAAVCSRIALNRVGKAFAAVEDADSEIKKRSAAAAVARSAIAGGTMAASNAIGELPAGIIRDEAVVELVLWLRQTNSGDEAVPWEALIVDEKAKERLKNTK